MGVVRPNRAAPRLAGRGDPSPRGCPPYAPRAGGSQPAPRALFLHWRPYTKGRSGHWSAPTAERRRAASMSSRAKAGCTAPRAGARCQQPLRADSPARPAYSTTACSVASSAPAAAAPPPCAPAVAVERLEKARRHAPFARPATVRGRVCGRIGPLDLGLRRCEQVAEYGFGPFALGARATREPHASQPERRRLSRQRSSRAGQLVSHAERAALVWRFAAKRWSIGRTIGRRSVAQPSRSHRGQLGRPGAALERPDYAATTGPSHAAKGASYRHPPSWLSPPHSPGCSRPLPRPK